MISSFNLSKLNALLKDFHHMTGIRITVFDDTFHELAAYPVQIADFCQIIRTDETAAAQCHLCDSRACEIASRRRESYTYQCHAGLTESITPIIMGNIVIGYLLFGHVFSYPSQEEGWQHIRECCKNYQIDMQTLKNVHQEAPLHHRRLYCLRLPHHAGRGRLSMHGTDGIPAPAGTARAD